MQLNLIIISILVAASLAQSTPFPATLSSADKSIVSQHDARLLPRTDPSQFLRTTADALGNVVEDVAKLDAEQLARLETSVPIDQSSAMRGRLLDPGASGSSSKPKRKRQTQKETAAQATARRQKNRQRMRERRQDPAYLAQEKAQKKIYTTRPEVVARRLEYDQKRASDPKYQKRKKAFAHAWYKMRKSGLKGPSTGQSSGQSSVYAAGSSSQAAALPTTTPLAQQVHSPSLGEHLWEVLRPFIVENQPLPAAHLFSEGHLAQPPPTQAVAAPLPPITNPPPARIASADKALIDMAKDFLFGDSPEG